MKVIVLIGEMGSGKSYHGRELAQKLGYRFIEGDDFGPPAMQKAIKSFAIISNDMIDNLVVRLALDVSSWQIRGARGVVVAQALYRKNHRDDLRFYLGLAGINDVEFRWVKVPFFRHMRQLLSRPRGWRWVIYCLMSKPFWEAP